MQPDELAVDGRLDARIARMLRAWSEAAVVEGRLGGGHRNTMWAVRVGGRRYAARLSTRPEAALDWEIALLDHLRTAGMVVPEILPARDGRARVEGLVLFGWLEGEPPSTERDWRLAADELDRLHALTRGWPQRPAFRSSQDLLAADRGGDARLDLMPADVVERVRRAWHGLSGEPMSVVHGDPGGGNIRMQGARAGLIDWDEARVDVSLLDLAALPAGLALPVDAARLVCARRAAVAWEVANGWVVEPTYARRRLREL
jgi:Ser/Thr protein kinase RdoA (MazF antagonist)